MASETTQFSLNNDESNEEMAEMFIARKRICFCLPCFGWQRMRTAESDDDGWWNRGINSLKKIREWSEIAAGPRWKTFIRRFNRSKSGGPRHGKFQYDPLSYSLNFDEGPGQNSNLNDEEFGYRNFSSRYAAIPTSTKSSMDLGSDAPAFT